jgi:outer membrane protein assembly factor BamB
LHGYNVVAILYGHGHRIEHRIVNGIDTLQGGSTFGKNAGFGIYTVKDGVFYSAYSYVGEKPMKAMLKKPLSPKDKGHPEITILQPQERNVIRDRKLDIEVKIAPTNERIKDASFSLDGGKPGKFEQTATRDIYTSSVSTADLGAGAHVLKVFFTLADGKTFTRSTSFYLEQQDSPKVKWRKFFPAGIKSTPVFAGEKVYFGANDGILRVADAKTGDLRWEFSTRGEIHAKPLIYRDAIYFGSGDKCFYALTLDGQPKWAMTTEAPVYCSASADDGTIFFGTNGARIYAVDAETGDIRWVFSKFNYSVESQVVVSGDSVYFGAWDGYVYALDKATGNLKWREWSLKAQEGGPRRYYSAADCPPVVADGKVFFADRGYYAGYYDTEDGSGSTILQKNTSAISLSQDANAIYCRLTKGGLKKIDTNGNDMWRCSEHTGRLPIPPVEKKGLVYTTSNTGQVTAIDATSGELLWKYQATPQIWIMAGLAVSDDAVVVAGLDGSLTALQIPTVQSIP